MKKKIKLLAIILTVLITVLCLPVNALASDVSEVEENSSTEVSFETTESSVETTVETETMIFEFTEDETLPNNSRMIGDGGEVDFGPPDGDASNIISDGVYAIENFFYPGIWMDATTSSSANAVLRQNSYTESPLVSFTRSALFKIRYVSETNSYIIRLMTNNLLSIERRSNYFYTADISPYDNDHEDKVDPSETFTITYSDGGYIISPYNNQLYAICSNGSVAGDSNGSAAYLRYQLISTAGNNAKWKLHKYTGAHKNGATLYYTASWKTVGIPVGTTGTMSCKTWTTKIGANTPYKRVAADSRAMISTSFNFDTNKMSFEALSPGKAKIYSMILEGTSEPSKYTVYSYFQVIPKAGTYFIKNQKATYDKSGYDHYKYMNVEPPYTGDGRAIQQSDYSPESPFQWIIEYATDGYVYIKSSESNKYLGVYESNGAYKAAQYGTKSNNTLWKFERTSAGNTRLVCKAFATTLALSAPSVSDGEDLVLSTYTDDSEYNDEWVSYFVQYSYTLHHYYDHGYNTRFSDSESTAMEKIETYHNAVSERLMQIFGVVTYANYELIESCVDSCQEMLFDEENCYNDVNNVMKQKICNHGTDGENIHMKPEMLIEESNWSNILMPVIWTGYILPKIEEEDEEDEIDFLAGTFDKSIVITYKEWATHSTQYGYMVNVSYRNNVYTLFHEVCHSLEANDHYCYRPNNQPCNNSYCDECVYGFEDPRDCIMTKCPQYGVEGTANEDLLCSDCLQVIRNHLADHH